MRYWFRMIPVTLAAASLLVGCTAAAPKIADVSKVEKSEFYEFSFTATGLVNESQRTEYLAEAERQLEDLKAQAAQSRIGDEMAMSVGPFTKDIAITPTAAAGRLVSYERMDASFMGGAHPNTVFEGIILDTLSNKRLGLSDLFTRPAAEQTEFLKAVCDGLAARKREREVPPDVMGDPIICTGANANAAPEEFGVVLVPATNKNKIAGLEVVYSPYAVGAYAEGAYWVFVKADAFKAALRPEYRKLFGGVPQPIDRE